MLECTYGTRVKAGIPSYVWLTWDLFVAFVTSRIPRLGILNFVPWSDILTPTATFCASEIPIPSAPGLTVWVTALGGNLTSLALIADYVTALYQQYMWSLNCECIPNPSPSSTCYTGIPDSYAFNITTAPPSGWEEATGFVVLSSSNCYGLRYWQYDSTSATRDFHVWDMTVSPNVPLALFSAPTVHGLNTLTLTSPIALVTGRAYRCGYRTNGQPNWYNSTKPSIDNAVVQFGGRFYSADFNGVGPGGTDGSYPYGAIEPLICNADPSGRIPFILTDPSIPTELPRFPDDPVCSTTSDICSRLLQLEDKLTYITEIVRYISTTTAPTGYTMGASHSVSGHGTLDVTDIVGVLVEPSVPTRWGRTSDTPKRYIPKVGAIHFGDPSGDIDENQIHYDEQLVLGAPPTTTVVAYSFGPGITAVVTELLRLK